MVSKGIEQKNKFLDRVSNFELKFIMIYKNTFTFNDIANIITSTLGKFKIREIELPTFRLGINVNQQNFMNIGSFNDFFVDIGNLGYSNGTTSGIISIHKNIKSYDDKIIDDGIETLDYFMNYLKLNINDIKNEFNIIFKINGRKLKNQLSIKLKTINKPSNPILRFYEGDINSNDLRTITPWVDISIQENILNSGEINVNYINRSKGSIEKTHVNNAIDDVINLLEYYTEEGDKSDAI